MNAKILCRCREWPVLTWMRTVLGLLVLFIIITECIFSKNISLFKLTITREHCSPRSNIVFLKTHKCASSSIQNILMRYGDVHNLTLVIPFKGNIIYPYRTFRANMVPDPTKFGQTYNILAHHCRFNYSEVKKLMPLDSIYITIVRHPVDIFESMFSYYDLNKYLYHQNISQVISKFQNASEANEFKRYGGKFGFNQMLFDFGFNLKDATNWTAVNSYIKLLDSIFDLVMVSERMDESLVLLRNLLCWDIEDVVALKFNARKPDIKYLLTPEEKDHLLNLNMADYRLYRYFVKRFEKRVKAFGKEILAAEVRHLRERNQYWYKNCVSKEWINPGLFGGRVVVFRANDLNDTNSYVVCKAVTTQEIEYTAYFRKKQDYLFSNWSSPF